MRLWARDACTRVGRALDRLALTLVTRADEEIDTLLPAYTHTQRAQPNRLAHHLLAWVEMLERDRGRLDDCAHRMNECPLGAGAVCGTTFPLDRELTAGLLGFDRPARNSLDATADRDFVLELLAALSIASVHLSRVAEEMVWWSTQEFGFVEMADAHATGSSMMPQKKNPDVAEVVRGKSGRVIGDLVALLVVMKGLPLGYNRDLQEDKEPVFDAVDTVRDSADVLADAIGALRFRRERMREALGAGYVNATEVADYLAARGVPFRHAHEVAGRLVARAIDGASTSAPAGGVSRGERAGDRDVSLDPVTADTSAGTSSAPPPAAASRPPSSTPAGASSAAAPRPAAVGDRTIAGARPARPRGSAGTPCRRRGRSRPND